MQIKGERWTMNNELFIVYRLTFIVLARRASRRVESSTLPLPTGGSHYFLNNTEEGNDDSLI